MRLVLSRFLVFRLPQKSNGLGMNRLVPLLEARSCSSVGTPCLFLSSGKINTQAGLDSVKRTWSSLTPGLTLGNFTLKEIILLELKHPLLLLLLHWLNFLPKEPIGGARMTRCKSFSFPIKSKTVWDHTLVHWKMSYWCHKDDWSVSLLDQHLCSNTVTPVAWLRWITYEKALALCDIIDLRQSFTWMFLLSSRAGIRNIRHIMWLTWDLRAQT